MGIRFNTYLGSGKATCVVCKEKITKKEVQVHAESDSGSWACKGNAHLSCINKMSIEWNLTITKAQIRKEVSRWQHQL